MKYYKQIINGYIVGVGEDNVSHKNDITIDEYQYILSLIKSLPVAPDGFYYKLREDFTLELNKIENYGQEE